MPYNHRGYRMLRLDPTVLTFAPNDVRKSWDAVTAAQGQYRTAADLLPAMEKAAKDAPNVDAAAARAAVEAGKPIPNPTAPTAADAADKKRREVQALAQIAADREDDFLTVLDAHRTEISAQVRESLAAAITAADASMSAFLTSADTVASLVGLWRWTQRDDDSLPGAATLTVAVGDGQRQSMQAVADLLTGTLNREHPVLVEEKQREWEQSVADAAGMPAASVVFGGAR